MIDVFFRGRQELLWAWTSQKFVQCINLLCCVKLHCVVCRVVYSLNTIHTKLRSAGLSRWYWLKVIHFVIYRICYMASFLTYA